MKPLFTILLFLCLAGVAYTQKQASACIDLNAEMKSLCNLTPEQATKVQPIITDFEKKRDSIYTMYRYSQVALTYEANQNRRSYETNLIGVLNPSQMGLVKAFDSKNRQAMTHSCQQVTRVNYLSDDK